MRLRLGIVAVLGTVLLVAGCGKPGGVDGDLTNGWAAMEPTPASEIVVYSPQVTLVRFGSSAMCFTRSSFTSDP